MEDTSPTPVFSAIDYILFILVLVISFLIGVYYGFFSKNKQNTPEEYFLGSKNMGVIPVSSSLVTTFISGSNILGITADVYAHGTLHWQYVFSLLVMYLATAFIIMPVFFELQLPSVYSYVRLRYGRIAQRLAGFMFLFASTFVASMTLYVPALVLNHIAGLSIPVIAVVVGCVCIFYTTIGGFRAVIWADLFQALLMVGCCCAICFIGFGLVGGVQEVWEASQRGGRIIMFDFNPDPTIRLSTWTILFGHSFTMTHVLLNQNSMQRFLSMSDLAKARKAALLFYFGFTFFILISLVTALVIYTYFETCDPFRSGQIMKLDQITSFFVTKIAIIYPGLLGVFVAGIVAGSLSTVSSILNSSTVCLYEDFLKPFLPVMSQQRTCKMLKLLTLLLGCLYIGFVFVIQKVRSIFVIMLTVLSLTNGPTLGLFTMGMFLPRANEKGAVVGTITSIIGLGSIIIGGLSKGANPALPMRTDGCQHNFTISVTPRNSEDIPWIFRISFMYYTTVGLILVYLIGYPISLLTGGNKLTDQRVLATFMRKKSPRQLPPNDTEEGLPLKTTELTQHCNNGNN